MDLLERLQSTLGNAYTVERELGGGGMRKSGLDGRGFTGPNGGRLSR